MNTNQIAQENTGFKTSISVRVNSCPFAVKTIPHLFHPLSPRQTGRTQKTNSESMNTKSKHWVGLTAGILSLAGYASAANLGSEKYTYDASGNIIEKSIDGKVTKMSFDQTNRLIGKESPGQSKETTAYDAAGRPIVMKDVTGQPTRSMSYGYGDKVLETKSHGNNTGFYYNSEGQLVGKKSSSGIATYTWDGNVLAADGAETFTNEAHISGGVPLLNGGKDIIISDYLGNTLASGLTQFTNTAYGEGLEDGRFTGKSYVKELGAFVFQHRLYNSTAGSWATKDPLGFPDGFNGYAYVNGRPLTYYDVYGTTEEEFTIRDYAYNGGGDPPSGTPFVEVRFTVEYDKTKSPNNPNDEATIADDKWAGPTAKIKNPPVPVKEDVQGDSTRAYWKFTAEAKCTYEPGSGTNPIAYTKAQEFVTKSFEK